MPASEGGGKRWRGVASALAKAGVSAGLLWWLFGRGGVDFGDIVRQWAGMDGGWIGLAGCLMAVATMLGLVRWWLLLRARGLRVPLWEACAIGMIGNFFIVFSIGVVGGDLARVVYVIRHQPDRKAEAVLSIVADRVLGVLGLCIVALLVVPMNWALITANRETRALVWTILVLLGGGLVPVLLEVPGPWRRWLTVMDRLPFRERREQLGCALGAYFRDWRTTGLALAMSALIHGLFVVMWYCVVRALHLGAGFGFVAGMVPIVNTATSIPVTVSGFGVREAVLDLFFRSVGLGRDAALATSFTVWGLMACMALVGGVVYVLYRIPARAMREAGAA
ncbi:MAG: flippase-like domain-containing protein [Verrucomicrobiae bacterium]|nr:flippase-like domain-containing protein [Verrucomicrobiae bacterium]